MHDVCLAISKRTVVAFEIKLRRLTTYYVVAIVIPVLFLSLTATLVFALPADSGEKMGTSITVLLAFAVYLTIVSDQMPQTSSSVSIQKSTMEAFILLVMGVVVLMFDIVSKSLVMPFFWVSRTEIT